MELTALQQLVHQMYIAYYQRPADPEGLQYWVEQLEQNGDWTAVSAAFGAPENEENQALYGDLNREQTIAAIYQSAFNREAVAEEVEFWAASEFSATDLTFAIINGAQNDDLATVNNKVEFSAELVAQLETNAAYAELQDPKALLTAVTSETDVTAEYVSNAVASGKVGESFSLTADDAGEIFVGTANNDTFTAESGALAGTTIDGQGGNDTLNATYKAADFVAQPITRNVENINVNIDAFDGTATTFDATNVRGANIALSSTKLGFNGTAGVIAAAANSVTAGENVTDLTVAGLTTGTVDAGAAETVVVTGTATDAANVAVNGDVDLTVNTSTDLNIEATEDSVVTLSGSATSITGSGNGALTVSGDLSGVTEISGVETAQITNTTATNASEWEVNTVAVNADLAAALTVADDANVSINATQAGATVTGQGNTGSTVNVTSGLASVGSLTFAAVANANVNLTAAATVAALVTGGADTTVNVAGNTTITTLTSNADEVIFTGEGDVTVDTVAADAVQNVDASQLTGALVLTTSANGADVSISGGSGDNEVAFANTTANTDSYVGLSGNDEVTFATTTANAEASFAGGNNSVTANALTEGTLSVTGGAGNESISATALTTGTIAGNLAGGDDTLTLGGGAFGASTIAVDFGAGNDTLVLGASANLTAASFNVVGLENITVNTAATFTGSQLTGDSYNIAGTAADATLAVNATSTTGETIDLSGITLNNLAGSNVALTLTGAAGNDTLTGTGRADAIIGGDGADTMTGGAGADTFTIATDAVTAVAADVVTDFGNGADLLSFGGDAGTNTNYTEATAAVADFAAAKAAADAALTGVADEYNVQQVGSDVWVFHNDGTTPGADNVVKLTGVALDGIEFADIVA